MEGKTQILVPHLKLDVYSGQPKIQALESVTLTSGFHAKEKVVISIANFQNVISNPTYNQNFILTRTFRTSGINAENLNAERSIGDESRSIQYIDEKGRPSQKVEVMASPKYSDIISYSDYDGFGREEVKYLPYADNNLEFGGFRADAKVRQRNFYTISNTADEHVNKTDFPFSRSVMESSPLNRISEQGATGGKWQPNPRIRYQGHSVISEQGVNSSTDQVKLWVFNGATGIKTDGKFHPDGSLYKTTTKDENWRSGKAGTVEEYKDIDGRTLLKRQWKTEMEALDTYFVYTFSGDLSYVIPPKYKSQTITENSLDFNELIYAYKYDKRRRVIKKKIPGKGWEYIIYNKKNQVVYSRNAEQLKRNEWSFVKYDTLGRVIISGVEKGHVGENQATLINAIEKFSGPLAEERGSVIEGYTNNAYPKISTNSTVLIVNYYDDYSGVPNLPFTNHAGYSNKIQGLLTVNKKKVLGQTDWLWTVNHYDAKTRVVNVQNTNHLGGTDDVTNVYSFVGELTKSTRIHNTKGVKTILTKTNKYDHNGRLLWDKLRVGESPEIMVSKNEYNEIGQLKKKSLGGDSEAKNFTTVVDYKFNDRGWLKQKNSPQFSFNLKYDDASNEALEQYNGNIAQQDWNHKDQPFRTALYTYDKLNRLIKSDGEGYMSEELEYDEMGNINWLKRDGKLTNYTYENGGNSGRLLALTGDIKGNYKYDLNGNATNDRTGMLFSYNHLNLPVEVSGNGVKVSHLYDAGGFKLRKTSSTQGVRDYIGGIEYGANGIERITTSNGYLIKNDKDYTYYYNLTDNLGNIRAVVYRNPRNNQIETVQQQDYYSFGKTKQILAGGNNNYLYNGKEVQPEFGNQLDYGARLYDAEIGRWNVVDPKFDLYYSTSPYAYVTNNPIYFVDVNGEFAGTVSGLIVGAIAGAVNSFISDADFGTSVLQGALAGAVAGAAFDFTVATFGTGPIAVVGAAAASAAVGSAAEQFMETGTVSAIKTAQAGAMGAALGYVGYKAAPLLLKAGAAVTGYMEGQVAKTLAPAVNESMESMASTVSNMATKGDINPALVNFSQRTVSKNVETYIKDMRGSDWDWNISGPINIMKMGGKLVSYDNRRLLAAQKSGLDMIPYQIVLPSQMYNNSNKTWGEMFIKRFNDPRNINAGGVVPFGGLSTQPNIMP